MPELAEDLAPADDDALLEQAESIARDYCGWHIAPSRTGEVYTLAEPSTAIILPSLYVTAVESVEDAEGNAYDAADYTFTRSGVLKRASGSWWCPSWWPAGTVVTFTHGYSDVPASVTRAVQSIAAQDVSGLKSKTAGPFSETYADDMTPMDRARLDKYRLPSRP